MTWFARDVVSFVGMWVLLLLIYCLYTLWFRMHIITLYFRICWMVDWVVWVVVGFGCSLFGLVC